MSHPLIKSWRLLPDLGLRIMLLAGAIASPELVVATEHRLTPALASPTPPAAPTPTSSPITFRHDLYQLIHQRMCAEPPARAHVMAQLSASITARSFDAGARLMSVQWSAPQLPQPSLAAQMVSMAQQTYHHGGAWGQCDAPSRTAPAFSGHSPPWLREYHPLQAAPPAHPRYGWIITTPSPYAAADPHLAAALKTHCHHLELLTLTNSAAGTATLGTTQQISYRTWRQLISQPTLAHTQYRSISLRCLPRTPAWLGPMMWFLRHQSPPHSAPAAASAATGTFMTTLHHLINQHRTRMGLGHLQPPPPALHPALQLIAERLSRHPGLTHHHHELQQLTNQLVQTWGADYALSSLTELRVLADNPHAAYSQLISSPSHHHAIMHPHGQWLTGHQAQPAHLGEPPLTTLIIAHQLPQDP